MLASARKRSDAAMTSAAVDELESMQDRWLDAGEIDPAEAQSILLRAVELCAASVDAARDVFEAARGLIGATAQSTLITDEEVEVRARKRALEQALGGTTSPLTAQV